MLAHGHDDFDWFVVEGGSSVANLDTRIGLRDVITMIRVRDDHIDEPIRLTQEDGTRAWTSPVYLFRG